MDFHEHFTSIDWMVVGGYLLLTTWVGHLLKGTQSTIKDFFLGGRSLPWQAVSGSIIATEISGVTFIGVPGMIYAAGGDFTYLQWGIGSILSRVEDLGDPWIKTILLREYGRLGGTSAKERIKEAIAVAVEYGLQPEQTRAEELQ